MGHGSAVQPQPPMANGLKSWRGPTRAGKGHSRFFVSEISERLITMDSSSTSGQAPQELRAAEILIRALQAEGVKYIWGYPGGAVLHIF